MIRRGWLRRIWASDKGGHHVLQGLRRANGGLVGGQQILEALNCSWWGADRKGMVSVHECIGVPSPGKYIRVVIG